MDQRLEKGNEGRVEVAGNGPAAPQGLLRRNARKFLHVARRERTERQATAKLINEREGSGHVQPIRRRVHNNAATGPVTDLQAKEESVTNWVAAAQAPCNTNVGTDPSQITEAYP